MKTPNVVDIYMQLDRTYPLKLNVYADGPRVYVSICDPDIRRGEKPGYSMLEPSRFAQQCHHLGTSVVLQEGRNGITINKIESDVQPYIEDAVQHACNIIAEYNGYKQHKSLFGLFG